MADRTDDASMWALVACLTAFALAAWTVAEHRALRGYSRTG